MAAMSVDYLRISVTDRCNLRCIYCNPLGRGRLVEGRGVLSCDEIARVVGLCTRCGIRRVRLTGGEPLLREDIVELVRSLAGIPGVEDLSMTTNGMLLASVAEELKEVGLKRVNISLDAIDRDCYRWIVGADVLPQVLDGMHKAIEAGLSPVRINCVLMRDVNASQIEPLAEMTLRQPVAVRFIEYCPTTHLTGPASCYVPTREVRGIVESRFGPLSDLVLPDSGGPAVYFRIEGAVGAVGFISGRSSVFCHRCTRLRLSSDGKIKPCLYGGCFYDVGSLLRAGAGDDAVVNLLQRALREKNQHTKLNAAAGDFLMQQIGG
jgi:cyclic pyranopterin phosphate synthase